jgi:hypothetical protein
MGLSDAPGLFIKPKPLRPGPSFSPEFGMSFEIDLSFLCNLSRLY